MPNTALNRTTQALLTNKSGGALVYGDVVVLDNTNANGFTTTTSAGLSTRQIGVILEPNGIANNASGMVAICGWCPQVNLNTAATIGQFIKTHTVAGQATPHSSPQVEGDFGVALDASATPSAILFGSPNPPGGGSGTVTNTGTLTSGKVIQGNGGSDVTVSSLTATVVKAATGTLSAASAGTDYQAPLTTQSGACSADTTNGSANVLVDITGATVTVGAGTWILFAAATVQNTAASYVLVAISDSGGTDYSTARMNTTDANYVTGAPPPVVVTPGGSTTYKLRFQTARTDSVAKKQQDNAGQVLTRIIALQIA